MAAVSLFMPLGSLSVRARTAWTVWQVKGRYLTSAGTAENMRDKVAAACGLQTAEPGAGAGGRRWSWCGFLADISGPDLLQRPRREYNDSDKVLSGSALPSSLHLHTKLTGTFPAPALHGGGEVPVVPPPGNILGGLRRIACLILSSQQACRSTEHHKIRCFAANQVLFIP